MINTKALSYRRIDTCISERHGDNRLDQLRLSKNHNKEQHSIAFADVA